VTQQAVNWSTVSGILANWWWNTHTLFYGSTYNTLGYFASWNEQNVRSYHILNYQLRVLFFHHSSFFKEVINCVPMKSKIIAAYLKAFSKKKIRMVFSFLEYLFSFWR